MPGKKPTPEQLAKSGSEHGDQVALFAYAAEKALTDDRWNLLYAIPNAGKRSRIAGAWMKAEGLRVGVPDTFLALPRYGFINYADEYPDYDGRLKHWRHGLYIELKKLSEINAPNGGVSDAQAMWHQRLRVQLYSVEVCYGWQKAADRIEAYMRSDTPF